MLNVIYTLELTEMGNFGRVAARGVSFHGSFYKQVSSVSVVELVVSSGSCFKIPLTLVSV